MLLLACSAHAADRYPVRWDKVHPETIEHFTHLLHIDSSNPPGNETQVASYVKSVLDREGISAQLFALDPARANVVVIEFDYGVGCRSRLVQFRAALRIPPRPGIAEPHCRKDADVGGFRSAV